MMENNFWNEQKSFCFVDNLNDYLPLNNLYQTKENFSFFFKTDNPLSVLPFDIKLDLTSQSIEPGKASISQSYFEEILKEDNFVPSLLNDLYSFAVKTNNQVLCANIIVIISQLTYEKIKDIALSLALKAIKNKSLYIQELGIRCFENWERKDIADYLKNYTFEETWLNEYANDVYKELMEIKDVLLKKNQSWEMAFREYNSTSETERYLSRYGSNRVKNFRQQAFCLEN